MILNKIFSEVSEHEMISEIICAFNNGMCTQPKFDEIYYNVSKYFGKAR